VNVETLRCYARRGLLPTPRREPSDHRCYNEETARLLRAIKEAQALGFTLAEIAEYTTAAGRSRSPSEALRVRMAAKIDEIDVRIAVWRPMRVGLFGRTPDADGYAPQAIHFLSLDGDRIDGLNTFCQAQSLPGIWAAT
jgi:DNA-binding transcriptional MerR regulator